MQYAKKVTLIPHNSERFDQYGGAVDNTASEGILSSEIEPKVDKIKTKIYDKIHRFIKIILKLARNVGYDDDLRIKLKNGKYLDKSNIIDLLTHAMSVGKVLYGENEFIELLSDNRIDPDLIINENVKLKLIQYNKKLIENRIQEKEYQKTVQVTDEGTTNISKKRKNDDNNEDITPPPKKKRTIEVRDGDTIYLPRPIKSNTSRSINDTNKRAYVTDDEDMIEDSDIDQNRWIVP